MRACSIQGCDSAVMALGWCGKHYQRNRRSGDPLGIKLNPERRFWMSVEKGPDCWLWTGSMAGHYGKLRGAVAAIGAHRFSYELHHGPIPPGMVVMHSCDTPKCVNPAHLSVGTYKDNMDDMDRKGRRVIAALKGQECAQSKLNDDMVRWMRSQRAMTPTEMGRHLGVDPNTVRAVLKRKTWKHVE